MAAAAAAAASRGVGAKLGLREIRIHLCQRSPGSQGVRSISCLLHTPHWGCARNQAFGQEKNVSLNNFSADQVTRALENVLSGKA
ncbi:NADH dehydrogenase [ubiquinone] 1 alpha subcomplex subunit 2 [Myotis lucifugus]|uniref:NADH dehydrogenase [ubiquinone] 1 alpha subcomplex subunit 2 n=1 Tax=Myotis lucifugus TaxID=59463 RepID=UPI000CCC4025|nr:NADH dehydrogenase [ubiquinone] 1 alpha subcomplex subunit 2 [Myotis lucifugus]